MEPPAANTAAAFFQVNPVSLAGKRANAVLGPGHATGSAVELTPIANGNSLSNSPQSVAGSGTTPFLSATPKPNANGREHKISPTDNGGRRRVSSVRKWFSGVLSRSFRGSKTGVERRFTSTPGHALLTSHMV